MQIFEFLLKYYLDRHKIPRDSYSVNQLKEDSYCLIKRQNKWILLTYERGAEYPISEYKTLISGCNALISKLVR